MLREASLWQLALALTVMALAACVAFTRRQDRAGIAFGLVTLGMGLVALTITSEAIALLWMLMGVGILLVQLVNATGWVKQNEPAPQRSGWALLLSAGLWLALAALMVVRYLPSETYVGPLATGIPAELTTGPAFLFQTEHALAALGVALTLLAALIGSQLYREEG